MQLELCWPLVENEEPNHHETMKRLFVCLFVCFFLALEVTSCRIFHMSRVAGAYFYHRIEG